MYDFKGFHGKSAEHHAGKDHGQTYRFIAPTSDTFFFLIPLAILEHGHMSLQERNQLSSDNVALYVFFDQHFPHFRNLLRFWKLF